MLDKSFKEQNVWSIIKKKRESHYKIVLLVKTKLDKVKVLISKPLVDSNINHHEFALVTDVLKEYNDI